MDLNTVCCEGVQRPPSNWSRGTRCPPQFRSNAAWWPFLFFNSLIL